MSEDKHPSHRFFVDGKEYETDKSHLSGLEIKTIAAVDGAYQLYLEEQGDTPDRAISDGETVTLGDHIKHFFAVPPATFGKLDA
jgi:hypothetical protein